MRKKSVSVEILVAEKPITEYFHENNTFVEGRKNSPFKIKITNHDLLSNFLVIVSIDGLSVLDGELASEDSPGYIVKAGQELIVDGWRKDNSNVSEFVFDVKKNGYATQTNQSGYEGSVGIIIFKEINDAWDSWKNGNVFQPQWQYPHSSDNSGTFVFSSTSSTISGSLPVASACIETNTLERRIDITPDEPLAVGHGDNIVSEVREVSFEKQSCPTDIFVIFYDTKKGLEKRGIKISQSFEVTEPTPFPASTKHCKMPTGGWKK